MAMSTKNLARWLDEEVEFLKENQDYTGGYAQLGNGLAVVVLWSPGYGDEERDDVIQAEDNRDYALCAGIKVYNPSDTPDGWTMLSDKEGNILTDEISIIPDEDYTALAKSLLDEFSRFETADYDEDGVVTGGIKEVDAKKDESIKESKKGDIGTQIGFSHSENPEDEVEFDTSDEKEAKELFKDFCKENGFKNVEIVYVEHRPLEESKTKESIKESNGTELDSLGETNKNIVGEYFDHTWNFDFLDIVAKVVSRVDDYGDEDDIWGALDTTVLSTNEEWEIAKYYAGSPSNFDWNEVMVQFNDDIFAICGRIHEAETGEDEEDEDEEE